MAFLSHAQKRHFEKMLADKQIDQETFDNMAKDTSEKIPERVSPKKKGSRAKKAKKGWARVYR